MRRGRYFGTPTLNIQAAGWLNLELCGNNAGSANLVPRGCRPCTRYWDAWWSTWSRRCGAKHAGVATRCPDGIDRAVFLVVGFRSGGRVLPRAASRSGFRQTHAPCSVTVRQGYVAGRGRAWKCSRLAEVLEPVMLVRVIDAAAGLSRTRSTGAANEPGAGAWVAPVHQWSHEAATTNSTAPCSLPG